MTNTELEELEALLAAPHIEPLPWIRVGDWVVPESDWEDSRVCEACSPDVAHGDLIAKGINALPSLIARIRKLEAVAGAARALSGERPRSKEPPTAGQLRLIAALAALEEAKP